MPEMYQSIFIAVTLPDISYCFQITRTKVTLAAYVVGRMVDEGILEMAGFYDKTDNNKLRMTVGYRLKRQRYLTLKAICIYFECTELNHA